MTVDANNGPGCGQGSGEDGEEEYQADFSQFILVIFTVVIIFNCY